MQIVPMRELKNTVEIERLCAEEKGPVFVTKNGYGRLVVMDIDFYRDTIQKVIEAGIIIDGINDMRAGKIKDGYESVNDLRRKYEI